jgi:hypothetical protein
MQKWQNFMNPLIDNKELSKTDKKRVLIPKQEFDRWIKKEMEV